MSWGNYLVLDQNKKLRTELSWKIRISLSPKRITKEALAWGLPEGRTFRNMQILEKACGDIASISPPPLFSDWKNRLTWGQGLFLDTDNPIPRRLKKGGKALCERSPPPVSWLCPALQAYFLMWKVSSRLRLPHATDCWPPSHVFRCPSHVFNVWKDTAKQTHLGIILWTKTKFWVKIPIPVS